MKIFMKAFLYLSSLLACSVLGQQQEVERVYSIEGFKKDGDTTTLILKFKPIKQDAPSPSNNLPRQEDEEEDEPSTTPYIPAIIPGVTKIFNGLLTGNLNDIFHGSTSFAPKNVSYAIDTVYNQVVGLPPPQTTPKAVPVVANVTTTAASATVAETDATTVSTDDDDEGENENESDFVPKRFQRKTDHRNIVKRLDV